MSLLRELFTPRAGHASDFLAGKPVYDLVGPRTASGENVSPTTALRLSSYFACVRNVSEDLGKLPVCVVERVARGRRPLPEHPVSILLDEQVSDEMGAQTFRETLQAWALAWGNGYAEIVRDPRTKRPVELWPIHPNRVVIRRDGGKLWYDVRPDGVGEWIRFAPSEVFHLRGVGEGPYGYSIAQLAAESIGLGLAAELFGASLFGNDVAIGAVISVAAKMDEQDRKKWREGLQAAYSTARKAHSPLVLDGDAKIARLGIPPQDAQFLETREFQTEEIARWFRMPPHKIGHLARAQGWSTIEAANSDYVVDTLLPWATRWEGESRRKLMTEGERRRLSVKHYFQGLLRGDYRTRTEGYRTMISAGILTPNEARELEDLNPADEENADRLQVQGAMVLLESLGQEPAPALPPASPSMPPRDPEGPEDPEGPQDPEEGAAGEPPAEAPAVAATVAERAETVEVVATFPAPAAPPAPAPDPALVAALEGATARVARKEALAYARHAAKHRGDLPAFTRWARGFYEGLRGDLEAALAPAGDPDWIRATASSTVQGRARQALQLFADQVQEIPGDGWPTALARQAAERATKGTR